MSQMSDPDKYMQETGVPPAPQTPHQPDSHSAKPCEAGAPERPRPAHITYSEHQCSIGSALPTARLIMLGIVAAAAVLPRVDTRGAMAEDAPLVLREREHDEPSSRRPWLHGSSSGLHKPSAQGAQVGAAAVKSSATGRRPQQARRILSGQDSRGGRASEQGWYGRGGGRTVADSKPHTAEEQSLPARTARPPGHTRGLIRMIGCDAGEQLYDYEVPDDTECVRADGGTRQV